MRFATRLDGIKASGIRTFFEQASRMEDPVDLSIGQADFDVPEAIKAATVDAIGDFCGKYSPTQGYPDLVARSRAWLERTAGLPQSDDVMMTVGTTGAISLGVMALAGPGDEVLVPDPGFVMYPNVVRIAGATPVPYPLDDHFRPDLDLLERRFTPSTRLVIVNSPANPTGTVWTRAELGALAEIAGARGVPVLSDELYERFVYDEVHTSMKRFPSCESLIVGGPSKSHGMAGWRLGWAAGPSPLIDRMKILQQFCYTCPPTLVQRGAMASFAVDVGDQVARFREKRDQVTAALRAAGYDVVPPGGSFFVFPRVPWGDDEAFCRAGLARGLIVVPGSVFSSRRDHFRISLGADPSALARGLVMLADLARAG